MHCLDTYALMELLEGNPRFTHLFGQPFVLTTWTLLELYKTLLREYGKSLAQQWVQRLKPHAFHVEDNTLVKAVDFHYENRKKTFLCLMQLVISILLNPDLHL